MISYLLKIVNLGLETQFGKQGKGGGEIYIKPSFNLFYKARLDIYFHNFKKYVK